MTAEPLTVQVNQTVTITESVTSCTTHLFVQTVTRAGWALLVQMSVYMVLQALICCSVTVIQHATMEQAVTLSVLAMVCVTLMVLDCVIVILW
jgi:hypothetical protein